MKRLPPLAVIALVVAAGCAERPNEKSTTTAPPRSRLTVGTLPANASTVCVAAVKERDQLLAGGNDGATPQQERVKALDAVVDDTCY